MFRSGERADVRHLLAFSLTFLTQDLSSDLELADWLDWLASELQGSAYPCRLPLILASTGFQGSQQCPGFT